MGSWGNDRLGSSTLVEAHRLCPSAVFLRHHSQLVQSGGLPMLIAQALLDGQALSVPPLGLLELPSPLRDIDEKSQ